MVAVGSIILFISILICFCHHVTVALLINDDNLTGKRLLPVTKRSYHPKMFGYLGKFRICLTSVPVISKEGKKWKVIEKRRREKCRGVE